MAWAAIFRFYVLHNQSQAFTLCILYSDRYAILIHFCVAAHIHSQRWSGMHNEYTPKRWRICWWDIFIVVVSGASGAASAAAAVAVVRRILHNINYIFQFS